MNPFLRQIQFYPSEKHGEGCRYFRKSRTPTKPNPVFTHRPSTLLNKRPDASRLNLPEETTWDVQSMSLRIQCLINTYLSEGRR